MIQTEVKEIDGSTFQVRGLDLRTERAVLVCLAKALGPAIGELGTETAAGPKVLGAILKGISEPDVAYLCDTFMKVTQVAVELKGGEAWVPCTEGAFKQGVVSQLKWLWFCLEHQFGAFLGGNGATFLQDLGVKASPSSSPTT